jgi:hypothetical protein
MPIFAPDPVVPLFRAYTFPRTGLNLSCVNRHLTDGFSRNLPREMTGALTLDDFLRKWRAALRDGVNDKASYWEGQQAYLDLKRSEQLARVRLEEKSDDARGAFDDLKHPIAAAALWRICGALTSYKRDMKGVRDLVDFQKDQEDWLQRQAKAFRKRSARMTDRLVARELRHFAKTFDHTRREIRRRARLEDRPHDTYLAFVHPIRGHDKPQQRRQLDSQFQVRLGAILRTFVPKGDKKLRGPSLRTIARLVVLFLVCADLAAEDLAAEKDMKVKPIKLVHNSRSITVEGVLQQLRGAGIDGLGKNLLLNASPSQ